MLFRGVEIFKMRRLLNFTISSKEILTYFPKFYKWDQFSLDAFDAISNISNFQ